jgi:hypothetical protein
VYVSGLSNNITVYNASGSTNGLAYVQSQSTFPADGYVDFVIEYWSPLLITPNPTLRAEVVGAGTPGLLGGGGTTITGTGVHINRGMLLPDKTFLVEFASATNRSYYVQYSSDLKNWKTAQPAITGNGSWIEWVDDGQPKTESTPAIAPKRFYRVIQLQ